MATTTPQWKLRRLAPRALRILKRRAGVSPAVTAHLDSFGPQAEAYIAAFDRTAKYAINWKREMAEGRSAVVALLKQIQAWVPLLLRDLPGFDGSIYGDKPAVPDDVLEDGERLLSVIDEARTAKGEPLPYRQQALEVLEPLVKAAAKEWAEAEAADKEYQSLMTSLRIQADELQRNLAPLRRTLLAELGRSDKDYQKLRAERAGYPDDDDDPAAPPAPAPKPAAANAPIPTMSAS
jgi:hypothetical protein